ncbi:MAG: alpha-mannosidase, partial [Candidatus Omnitrophica bacterium]|nr:alpha-mannosidase [Candidatus Omnitrophota bacterium]
MHNAVRLCESSSRKKNIQIAVRVHSGSSLDDFRPAIVRPAHLEECALAALNEPARDFYHLAKSLHGALSAMPGDSWIRARLLDLLVEAFNRIDYRYPRSEEFYASIQDALQFAKTEIKKIPAPPRPETVTCVGHSHIDLAWLWPLQRTREKAIHTFSTALDLMRRYPEHRFFQSQAQLYDYVKNDQPLLFRQIKERIQQGQWEADGGMWVEADCNLPCGESLARQFLYGSRFFEEELGVSPKILWLPDVFGYSWALPQILRQAEIDYFVTSKISWNQYNQMPYDLFRWRGVDGSEILTYFITVPCSQWFYTYNGLLEPKEIQGTWENFKPKSLHNEVLLTYGYGDGGGGPTEEMLLTARSLQGVPGFPKTQIGRVDEFLKRLKKIQNKAPVWSGELYLELHRGTYTSQAQQKKWNREAEIRMQQTEFIACLAALAGADYPRERLRKIWERILLNQFHDIIPGSSIRAVYEDSARDYQWIRSEAQALIDRAADRLIQKAEDRYTILNTLGWRRSEPFVLDALDEEKTWIDWEGNPIEIQAIQTLDGESKTLARWDIHPFSANTIRPIDPSKQPLNAAAASSKRPPQKSPLRIHERMIENDILRIKFNDSGELSSVYDKQAKREVMAPRANGNVFQAFEDKPLKFDAWDVELYYQDKLLSTGGPAEFEIVQQGPLCAALFVRKPMLDGVIEQYISLYSGSRRIDFDTRIQWVNKDALLKVAFPVAIHASAATYDIQFGSVQRPTHWNTSWDWARFETCAQKWCNLSEGDYGVSLLNNGKYGHDIHDNVMRLTLIKCAGAPDPMADVGEHRFAYCLYPHPGDWRDARIPQKAYEFNAAPMTLPGAWKDAPAPDGSSFAWASRDNVVIDSIKMAEKENALILRLFECFNQRGPLEMMVRKKMKTAAECNLLERRDKPLRVDDYFISLKINPFEIKTIKIPLE